MGLPPQVMASAIMLLWLMTSLILLLNMLIAMMTKSYEKVDERSAYVYKFMFAQNVIVWKAQVPGPPPLTLLRLHVDLLRFVGWACSSVWRCGGSAKDDPTK